MSPATRRLKLRRADVCVACARSLPAGELAVWHAARRVVCCVGCDDAEVATRSSTAGSSARREYERRRGRREARARDRFGVLAPLALAVSGEPQHQRAWAQGAAGEVELARKLERWTADAGVVLLHDRAMPASRANVDHLAVGPSGVAVLDAKRYTGRISVGRRGGLWHRRTEHLVVAGRDRTRLVDGVLWQADAVRSVLAAAGEPAVPVRAVLCFVDGDWPLLGRLELRQVPVLPPRRAAKLCSAPGPLDAAAISRVAEALALALPPA